MLAILAQQADSTLFLPAQRSTVAPVHDGLYHFVFWMSVFWVVLIAGLLLYFVVKYRRKSHHDMPDGPTHSTAIELGWTLPPLILVMVIFIWGFRGFMHMNQAPNGATQILVSGQMWSWSFDYGIANDSVLHVPVNTPISLVLTSQDVIHSFYVPEFRVKKDVVPGRYNKIWFEATEVGEYNLFCTEYCGQGHSAMVTKVVVQTREDFDAYLKKQAIYWEGVSPVEVGRTVWEKKGCKQCHSLEGEDGTGPKWNDVFGSKREFVDGGSRVADEDYIRESILNPGAHIVQNYDNVMPTFQGQIAEQEITGVIELMKTLSDKFDGELLPPFPVTEGEAEGEATGEQAPATTEQTPE